MKARTLKNGTITISGIDPAQLASLSAVLKKVEEIHNVMNDEEVISKTKELHDMDEWFNSWILREALHFIAETNY